MEEKYLELLLLGKQKYLKAIAQKVDFWLDLPVDMDKYLEKIKYLAFGIESCWSIFSEEARLFYRQTAYGFTLAIDKCSGMSGLIVRTRLLLPSLLLRRNLYVEYRKSFLLIPKAVARAIEKAKIDNN